MVRKISSKSKMNTQQVTAIFLCALLGSTLGHEFLRIKSFAPEPISRLASPYEDRALANPPGECRLTCDEEDDKGHLQIIFNEKTQLFGVLNEIDKVALVIDINENLLGILDGSTGNMFILDLKSSNGTGVYIAGGLTKISWISSQATFEIFFLKLQSLKVFLDPKIGKTFTFSDISGDISNVLIKSLIRFSVHFGLETQGNIEASLTLLVKISLSISKLMKGALKGFLDAGGKGLIKLHGDFVWLGGVLEGLGVLFGNINGGLATLIAAKVKFDLALIFRAPNGLALCIIILFSIAAEDKITLLAGLLNSTDKLLALIVQLGGNVSTGVTGVFRIIFYINVLIRGKIKFEVFLKTLLEFAASRTSQKRIHLQIYIDALTKLVDISKASSSKELTEFVTWVNNLQAGKLFKGKLNISEIIEILVSGSVTNALVLVISVLLKLSVIVGFGIAVTIPALLFYLVLQLISPHGLSLLKSLGIETEKSMTSGDVISGLTKGINIQSILSILGGRFDVEKLGELFPAFGQIYQSVSVALRVSSNASYDLSTLVKSSSVQNGLSELIKGIVDLALTPNREVTIKSFDGIIGGIIDEIFGGGDKGGAGGSGNAGCSDNAGVSGSAGGSGNAGGSANAGGSGNATIF